LLIAPSLPIAPFSKVQQKEAAAVDPSLLSLHRKHPCCHVCLCQPPDPVIVIFNAAVYVIWYLMSKLHLGGMFTLIMLCSHTATASNACLTVLHI